MAAILTLLIGLAIGGVVAYLLMREKVGRATDKLALLEQNQLDHTAWEDRLKAATGDVLTRSQTSLLELTEARLAPIKETLTKFELQARQLEDKRAREVSAVDGASQRLILVLLRLGDRLQPVEPLVDQVVAQRRHDVQEDHAHRGHHHRRQHGDQAQPQRPHGGTAAAAVSRKR